VLLLRAAAFSQCEQYKATGSRWFHPNGGGFAEYVKAMPWVAERGIIALPDNVSFEEATFIEPINTILKAVQKARVTAGETVLIRRLRPHRPAVADGRQFASRQALYQ